MNSSKLVSFIDRELPAHCHDVGYVSSQYHFASVCSLLVFIASSPDQCDDISFWVLRFITHPLVYYSNIQNQSSP